MILYRPVSLQELELIYEAGLKAFPTHLPQQPIFYPVLQLEYAHQIAAEWNAQNGQLAGYVTQFTVEDQYLSSFEKHPVGNSTHQELWIPNQDLEEFNKHIVGHIKVVEAIFGKAFQGAIPEKFALQGKNAVEQFNWLANAYIYKRMDFYLELKRNHKAIFVNYLFWHQHEFENPALKEKILKAIKEAWFTSFPKTPLPSPANRAAEPASTVKADEPIHQLESTISSEIQPELESEPPAVQPDILPKAEEVAIDSFDQPDPVIEMPVKNTVSHFAQGLRLALSEQYQEAIEELSQAVEEAPQQVTAQISLGVALHRAGKDEQALASYEAALQLDLKSAEAHYFRANILYEQGHTREALAGYTTAIGLQPELIDADQKPIPTDRLTDYVATAAGIYGIAKAARHILELSQLLEADSQQAHLFKERAGEYARLGNDEQAIKDYTASLHIQPEDANALHLRGLAYERLRQINLAQKDYQRAIAIDPQLVNAYITRGITLGQMGNFRQSLANLTEAVRLAPENPDAYFNRGMTYMQQGEFEQAINDFAKVIGLSPNDEHAYYWRGMANEAAEHQREAIADYQQFLVFTQNPETRAEVQHKLSQLRAEIKSFQMPFVPTRQKPSANRVRQQNQQLDLYDLLIALGEHATYSTWFGSNIDCYGASAEELYALTEKNSPMAGEDFLRITSGIQKTNTGDFLAFDPGATSYWVFIRAWDGNGFYVETDDPQSMEQLLSRFEGAEKMEGIAAPYQGFFIRI